MKLPYIFLFAMSIVTVSQYCQEGQDGSSWGQAVFKGISSLFGPSASNQKKSEYEGWKEKTKQEWKSFYITGFLQEVIELTKWLKICKERKTALTTQDLYRYNFLRELLNLDPVNAIDNMDMTWVKQVAEEAQLYASITKMIPETHGWRTASPTQIQMLEHIQRLLKIRDRITILPTPTHTGITTKLKDHYVISLCNVPDIDEQLFIVYHELGHIMLGHLTSGWTPVDEGDRIKIEHYIELGKKAFDNSTPLGKQVNQLLARVTKWEVNWAPDQYSERLADLFAEENLLKQDLLAPILLRISNYAKEEGDRAISLYNFGSHPRPLERVLYLTGYLVSKGIDVNKAFKQWYAIGKCQHVPTEETLDELFTKPLKTKGARDFLRAYNKWLSELHPQERRHFS